MPTDEYFREARLLVPTGLVGTRLEQATILNAPSASTPHTFADISTSDNAKVITTPVNNEPVKPAGTPQPVKPAGTPQSAYLNFSEAETTYRSVLRVLVGSGYLVHHIPRKHLRLNPSAQTFGGLYKIELYNVRDSRWFDVFFAYIDANWKIQTGALDVALPLDSTQADKIREANPDAVLSVAKDGTLVIQNSGFIITPEPVSATIAIGETGEARTAVGVDLKGTLDNLVDRISRHYLWAAYDDWRVTNDEVSYTNLLLQDIMKGGISFGDGSLQAMEELPKNLGVATGSGAFAGLLTGGPVGAVVGAFVALFSTAFKTTINLTMAENKTRPFNDEEINLILVYTASKLIEKKASIYAAKHDMSTDNVLLWYKVVEMDNQQAVEVVERVGGLSDIVSDITAPVFGVSPNAELIDLNTGAVILSPPKLDPIAKPAVYNPQLVVGTTQPTAKPGVARWVAIAALILPFLGV